MNTKKILIVHPDLRTLGGIQLYYSKIKKKFTIPVGHYPVGSRYDEKGFLLKIKRIIFDYFIFVKTLKRNSYEIVHINPALDYKMFIREGIFHLIAKMFKKKTIVYFRGWNKSLEYKITRHGKWLFKLIYGRANAYIVLAEQFKSTLRSWGCIQPIYREVTIIDDADCKAFDIHETLEKRQKCSDFKILFLARISKEKGIYVAIETLSILCVKHPKIRLIIAGDGDELENVKTFVSSRHIPNVVFTGDIRGNEKDKLLKNVHLLCLPTYYGEGLPNSIVESMGVGLPVVTRRVGGIADFFKDGEHGFATTSKDPVFFSEMIERLYLDQDLYKKISLFNYHYAQEKFLASQAASRLEGIYKAVLE